MAGHGRRKKRRMTPQDEEAARRRFLDSLESQRSNARSQDVRNTVEHLAAPEPLPGFYYDEAKRRYFRKSPASERQSREVSEFQPQTFKVKPEIQVRSRRKSGNTWVAYIAQRQADYAWSARRRDSRELMPKLISEGLLSPKIESQDLYYDGRLTALALHPRVRHIGAIGASSGTWQVLKLQQIYGSELTSQRALPISDSHSVGVITSLQWRPVQELDILVCHVGAAQRSDSVVLIRVGDYVPPGNSVMSSARMTKTCFYNPWIAKWNPSNTSKLSVGHGDYDRPRTKSRAAYVDIEAESDSYQCAPSGLITSDVHAQSFFSTGNVVLNGTKCGGLWGWDLRAPHRIFELKQEALNRPASIVDIHVLNNCCQTIVQRSNGELRLLDLRTLTPVVEYMPGAAKRYVPGLRCGIDDFESIVVAGGDVRRPLAITSFDLRQGHSVSTVEVHNTPGIEKRSTLVQQVEFKSNLNDNRSKNTPEIWAVSRNELYVSSGQRDDSNE